ncbi:MAG TPA: PAS domain S-box protein, partial [Ferruginibacter sp.]|nr:PAS domain S-box protein [Ferruginibacter sp.]
MDDTLDTATPGLDKRDSGIEILGGINWGTHFCSFYETTQDLLDIVVPFFKAGLENNEFCVWIVSNSALITVEEATQALEKAVPDLRRHILEGQIEIFKENDWYLEQNKFNLERMSTAWDIKLQRALTLGYDGMRVSGDTFWLKENDWKDFSAYEKQLNDSIIDQPMTALCTYPLSKTGATAILDVVHAHQFTIARRKGKWETIETPEQLEAKAELKRLNDELQRVKERVHKPTLIRRYVVALLAAIASLLIILWMRIELSQESTPIVAMLLCAIMFSSWYGGMGPGLLTFITCLLGFIYFFLTPVNSWALAINEIPRLIIFMLSALFIGSLSVAQKNIAESLRKARDVLAGTVQKLRQTNTALQDEIAERKYAEVLLHSKEQEFRAIVENSPDQIIRYDRNFRRAYVNPAVTKVYGLPAEALIGKQMGSVFSETGFNIKEEELAQIHQQIADVFDTGQSHEYEITVTLPGGSKHYTVRLFPELDLEGTVMNVLGVSRDITERKQAEDALRKNEDRIRLIIDTIPVMAWTVQPDGIVDYYNQRWLDYAGEDAIKNPVGIVHPDDLPAVMEKWLEKMAAEEPSESEMRIRRADGVYQWFLVRTAPLRDEQGNLVKWYGVSIDIEKSKQAEDELRLAYQRVSYHVENTPLAIIEFDKELFIRRWSKHAEDIFGWKETEALGKNIYDPSFPFICEDDIETVNKTIGELLSGTVDRNISINCNYNKDGSIIYCEWYNSVLKDEQGNVITILSFIHNETEKKIAEEQVRQREAHLAEAQQLAKMGSWDYDIQSDSLNWSDELYNVFGTDKRTFRETHDSFLHLIDEEDREFALNSSRHTQQTGQPFTIEYHITTPQGEKRLIQEHGYGQADENGKVVRLFGTAQDITERKKAEDALSHEKNLLRT